ncbi:MAG: N-acetyltransferase family protein [Pseudomonadales bacterium]
MGPESIQIRDARAADLATLQAFAVRTWLTAFAYSFADDDEAQRHIESELSLPAFTHALEQDTLLLALAEGTLLGYAQLGDPEFTALSPDPGDLQLRRLYVEPEQHARGLGSRLLDATVARAQAAGAQSLWLEVWQHNQRAARLYRRYGFETVAARRYYDAQGQPLDFDYVMRARIR